MRKEESIEISFHPLQASGGIDIIGGVPGIQVYQSDKKEYTPDYTLTPLVLLPRCNATDPSAKEVVGNVNKKLTNVTWHEVEDGKRTQIIAGNANYVITTEGKEKGKLLVKRNVKPLLPVTLEFRGEYVERSGERMVFQYRYLIRCVDGSEAVPVLSIDSPSGGLDWNPIREVTNQTITAKMMLGDRDVTEEEGCRIWWYRVLPSGVLEEVKTDGENDFEVVSLTKNILTINRDKMGESVTYVVKGSYTREGAAAAEPDESIGYVSTAIRRKIPALEIDWKGLPREIPQGTQYIHPVPVVKDTKGVIDNPEKYFRVSWYRRESGGGLTLLTNEWKPKLPYKSGMKLVMDIQDLGPLCLVVSEGKLVTVNGKALLARKLQP